MRSSRARAWSILVTLWANLIRPCVVPRVGTCIWIPIPFRVEVPLRRGIDTAIEKPARNVLNRSRSILTLTAGLCLYRPYEAQRRQHTQDSDSSLRLHPWPESRVTEFRVRRKSLEKSL